MLRFEKTIVILMVLAATAACGNDPQPSAHTAARPDSASGEVAQYALMKNAIGWLTDSNVVALATQVNADVQSIPRLETQAWMKESLRLIAADILRDHASLQVSIDSAARIRNIPSQLPAVAPEMKAPYDSLLATQIGLPIAEREAQFIDMVIKAHERSITDFGALAGNTADPDLRAVIANRAVIMEQTHIGRARVLAAAMVSADSARQDSLKAKRKKP